jgi:hypothetical protein
MGAKASFILAQSVSLVQSARMNTIFLDCKMLISTNRSVKCAGSSSHYCASHLSTSSLCPKTATIARKSSSNLQTVQSLTVQSLKHRYVRYAALNSHYCASPLLTMRHFLNIATIVTKGSSSLLNQVLLGQLCRHSLNMIFQ